MVALACINVAWSVFLIVHQTALDVFIDVLRPDEQ